MVHCKNKSLQSSSIDYRGIQHVSEIVPTIGQPLGGNDRKYSWSGFPLGPWADKNKRCGVSSFGTVRSTFDQRHSQRTCSFSEHNMHPPNTKARLNIFRYFWVKEIVQERDQDSQFGEEQQGGVSNSRDSVKPHFVIAPRYVILVQNLINALLKQHFIMC